MHNLGKIPDLTGRTTNTRNFSQDRWLPRSELSTSHIQYIEFCRYAQSVWFFRRFAKRKATLASSCQSVRIGPTHPGKKCVKFRIMGFYKNFRTHLHYGENRAKIIDILHKDLYTWEKIGFIRHCLLLMMFKLPKPKMIRLPS